MYTAKELTVKLQEAKKTIRMSGVGAHHQNGPAENAIKNITRRARIFLFHAALRWPEKFDKHLWPLVMNYAVHLHNHTPRQKDLRTPASLWTRTPDDLSALKHAHPWGCPVYVLDPRLQDGHKLPRWNSRACQGTFVGITDIHASSVGLIRNPTTNRLSPQFHCIYDDYFETVTFNDRMPPPNWEELTLESLHKHPFDEKIPEEFIDNWDVPEEVTGAPPQREPDTELRPRKTDQLFLLLPCNLHHNYIPQTRTLLTYQIRLRGSLLLLLNPFTIHHKQMSHHQGIWRRHHHLLLLTPQHH